MADSIQSLLENAYRQLAGQSPTPHLDADVLLCHVLDKSRSFLKAWPEHVPDATTSRRFKELVQQRMEGFPVAYLTGKREFWSREFLVNSSVLIPRPDTELLIEIALSHQVGAPPCKAIDLGTGSGIIAVTLAAERPQWTVFATDISESALEVARKNAKALSAHNVFFRQSNWFSTITEREFDLVISNPPYIDKNDKHLSEGDVRFEPSRALISEDEGLRDIRIIASQSRNHLKSGGYVLIEHGYTQGSHVKQILEQLNYQDVTTYPDLAGNDRVTSGLWLSL